MIPYAGFDASENQFGTRTRCVSSARNLQIARLCRKRIDVDCARKLKAAGLTHRTIGQLLASAQGRTMPYTAISVYRALKQ